MFNLERMTKLKNKFLIKTRILSKIHQRICSILIENNYFSLQKYKMKKTILLFTILSATNLNSQVKISANIFGGGAINHTNHAMAKFGGDLYVTFSKSAFVGLGANFGINGNESIARNVVNNRIYSIYFGHNHIVSDRFSVQPYIGFGYQKSVQTENVYDTQKNELTDLISSGVSEFTDGDVNLSFEKRYEKFKRSTVGIPVGVNFLIGKKSVGCNLGYYLFISNYPETGVKIGFTFGRLR